MTDLYTSYATSVALRDAGAPQDGNKFWWTDSMDGTHHCCDHRHTNAPCAFRADELIEALGDRLDTIVRYREPEEYRVVLADELGSSLAYSLVEALAQAWLAVLREVKP